MTVTTGRISCDVHYLPQYSLFKFYLFLLCNGHSSQSLHQHIASYKGKQHRGMKLGMWSPKTCEFHYPMKSLDLSKEGVHCTRTHPHTHTHTHTRTHARTHTHAKECMNGYNLSFNRHANSLSRIRRESHSLASNLTLSRLTLCFSLFQLSSHAFLTPDLLRN